MSDVLSQALGIAENAFAAAFWFIVVIGILVFLHEAGHFLTAKAFGMKVDVFSLGFGKRLFGRKRGETDYRVSLIPLGGYVKLTGGEEAGEEGEQELQPDWFLSRPRWQRFLVMVMGAAVNLVLALVLYAAAFTLGVEMPAKTPPVVAVVAADSLAEQAGLRAGDRIVSIQGDAIDSWEGVVTALLATSERVLVVERDGRRETLRLTPRIDNNGLPDIGAAGQEPAIVGQVIEGKPADRIGLMPNDHIVSVDGVEIVDLRDLQRIIGDSIGVELTLAIMRDGQLHYKQVVPEAETVGKGDDAKEIGRIGFAFKSPTEWIELPPLAAVGRAFDECVDRGTVLFAVLGRLVTFQMSPKTFGGPIQIARVSAAVAREGLQLLVWMGFISLQLGILNLLPIPVLDGGHIVVLLTEGVLRRDLSMAIKERLQMVGFYFLVALMVGVLGLDIWRLIRPGG